MTTKTVSYVARTLECRLNPDVPCEICQLAEICPYILCQHEDCMECTEQGVCPMCHGHKCKECSIKVQCLYY